VPRLTSACDCARFDLMSCTRAEAVNQFLCKAVKCAWAMRVKSHFKSLFTISVENVGYQQFGSGPERLSSGEGRTRHKKGKAVTLVML